MVGISTAICQKLQVGFQHASVSDVSDSRIPGILIELKKIKKNKKILIELLSNIPLISSEKRFAFVGQARHAHYRSKMVRPITNQKHTFSGRILPVCYYIMKPLKGFIYYE